MALNRVAEIREAWAKACEHDGIDPAAKFVEFSKNNPWAAKYNTLMTKPLECPTCKWKGAFAYSCPNCGQVL
jgi:hypothetical protein